jgi:CubicO group peptidase (beta-lactamase class C family)
MRRITIMFSALLAGLGAAAWAQQGPSLLPQAAPAKAQNQAPSAPNPASATLTKQDAEAWLDGYMPFALNRSNVAGAAVVIVKDGQILLQKGYGFSDVAKRIPVDPERTLFRPGSVSKLFTWTAVMQLVEQGKLNLDADVNQYLDFKIPPREGKPITLRNIMTHTAGFEEAVRGLITSDVNAVGLERRLKLWTPERAYAPGTTPAYSNYATALAGYIVQRVSGEPFEDYIDRHILVPLNMRHSSFHQPLPAALARDVSKGYPTASDAPKPYEYVPLSPAGSLASTGPDMARFMIAHLQDGTLDGAQILRPETARMMHSSALTILPPLHRMLLGFYENDINGHRVITHAGDTQYFHSELNLFLDDHVGMFVSVNSGGKEGGAGTIRAALLQQFADRYFPGEPQDGAVNPQTAAAHAAAIAGMYDNSRRADENFFAALSFLSQTAVKQDGKGSIIVPSIKDFSGTPMKWREIAPYVWRQVGGKTRLAAQVVDGRVVRFSIDSISPFMVFDRAGWWRSTAWMRPAIYAALAALLLTALLWPIAAIVRRRFAAPLALAGRPLWVHRGVRIAALLGVLVPVGWMLTVQSVTSEGASAVDAKLLGMAFLTLIAFVGGLLLAGWNVWIAWREKRGWFTKLWSVALLLSFAVLTWFATVFKLLSFTTRF